MGLLDDLERLSRLHNEGALTTAQFEVAKERLLEQVGEAGSSKPSSAETEAERPDALPDIPKQPPSSELRRRLELAGQVQPPPPPRVPPRRPSVAGGIVRDVASGHYAPMGIWRLGRSPTPPGLSPAGMYLLAGTRSGVALASFKGVINVQITEVLWNRKWEDVKSLIICAGTDVNLLATAAAVALVGPIGVAYRGKGRLMSINLGDSFLTGWNPKGMAEM